MNEQAWGHRTAVFRSGGAHRHAIAAMERNPCPICCMQISTLPRKNN